MAVLELEKEQNGGQYQYSAVGENDGHGIQKQAVDQPQDQTCDQNQQHPQREVFGRLAFPGLVDLWNEGDGGKDTCKEANVFDIHDARG